MHLRAKSGAGGIYVEAGHIDSQFRSYGRGFRRGYIVRGGASGDDKPDVFLLEPGTVQAIRAAAAPVCAFL